MLFIKHNGMKKTLLLFVLFSLVSLMKGQEIVTEFWHENSRYFNFHNMVETNDHYLIVECPMFVSFSGYEPALGIMFYKFSIDGTMVDSLLLDDPEFSPPTLFEQDPEHLDNYVFAYFKKVQDTLFFRMKTIDKDLNIIMETDLEIDHSQALFDHYTYDFFVEPQGDIIASYTIKDDTNETHMAYFLRIGFDGTMKDRREVPQIWYFDDLLEKHTGVYSNSPLLYWYWGHNRISDTGDNPPIRLYVLDSLFNVVEEKCLYSYQGCFYSASWYNHFAPVDDQHYLLVNNYDKLDANYNVIKSVLLEKRNRQHAVKARILIGESRYYQPQALRAIAVDSNTIYLSYMTTVGGNNQIVVLRLDGELDVQWERYLYSNDMFHWATCMRLLQDGTIAVGSYQYLDSPNSISVVIIKDNYDDLEEMGIHVRPYDFYPNPAQSELHLHYSPDVTPKQIELYDLQGRLLQTQTQNLESIGLEGLAAGQYLMKVTLKDGKTFTDKVLKK